MSLRPLLILVSVGLLAGCSSNAVHSPGAVATGPRRAQQHESSFYLDLPAEPGLHSTRLAGTPQLLYPLVAAAYDALGIPIETIQSSTYLLGNEAFRAGLRVGGIAVSSVVACGAAVSGVGAESNVITLSLTTQLRPLGADSALLSTSLAGTARTMKGVNSNPVRCTTRGALEERIAEEVQKRLTTS